MRKAFTLVEILVVVSIIAVIASLLLPAMATVRSQALSTKCLSNQRQLGLGLFAFADDNKGGIPPVYGRPWSDGSRHWNFRLAPYVDEQSNQQTLSTKRSTSMTWGCPVFKDSAWFHQNGGAGDVWSQWDTGYGMLMAFQNPGGTELVNDWFYPAVATGDWSQANSAGNEPDCRVRLATIPYPANQPIISDFVMFRVHPWWDNLDINQRSHLARHRGKTNALFVDGHVAAIDTLGWLRKARYPNQ
jgi:prepilin-type processing-associated H-X9-DG protein/prepilin-type N-terminal cleavage/methylation domain-containing protein